MIIVRNRKEKTLYPHHANVIVWPIGEVPPNLESYEFSALIVTNVYPMNEQIQWWLEKSKYPYVIGK